MSEKFIDWIETAALIFATVVAAAMAVFMVLIVLIRVMAVPALVISLIYVMFNFNQFFPG